MFIFQYQEPLRFYYPGHAIVLANSKEEADQLMANTMKSTTYTLAYWQAQKVNIFDINQAQIISWDYGSD